MNWDRLYPFFKPFFFALPPETAHSLSLHLLHYLPIKAECVPIPAHSKLVSADPGIFLWGMHFPHRVGLAAGFDKNADYLAVLAKLGFAFVEVGTVTPKPQMGNPKPRLFRLSHSQALINRMGFNNKGVDHLCKQLSKTSFQGIIGVNIGKNAATAHEDAWQDYAYCYQRVYPYADYIVLNISSPNTAALRQLQLRKELETLLERTKSWQDELTQEHGKYIPTLIKIAPDLEEQEIEFIAQAALKFGLDGMIATNTTISRKHISKKDQNKASEQGGLSGPPLKEKSLAVFKQLAECINGKIPLIACGGISSIHDAMGRFEAGADLIQIYTGMIFQGPGLIQKLKTLPECF